MFVVFIADTPCKPNPCYNNGRCKEISQQSYKCDCTGTMYIGEHCDTGIILLPAFPHLILNKESSPLQVFAKPTGYLTITPKSESSFVDFTPSVIRILTPDTSATFTVTASEVGEYEIAFDVDGLNDFDFQNPNPVKINVFGEKMSLLVDMNLESITEGACNAVNISKEVTLKSTCNDDSTGLKGFISVNSKNLNLPLSMTGVSSEVIQKFKNIGALDPTDQLDVYLSSSEIPPCQNHCRSPSNATTNQLINYATRFNFFQVAFLKQVSTILPMWLEMYNVASGPDYRVQNMLTKIATGDKALSTYCSLPSEIHSTFFSKDNDQTYSIHQSDSPVKIKVMDNEFQTSVANELCYLTSIDLSAMVIHSSIPFNLVTSAPDHIIESLEITSIKIVPSGTSPKETVSGDFKLKMKSFDGNFEGTTFVTWSDSEKVTISLFVFSHRFIAF